MRLPSKTLNKEIDKCNETFIKYTRLVQIKLTNIIYSSEWEGIFYFLYYIYYYGVRHPTSLHNRIRYESYNSSL